MCAHCACTAVDQRLSISTARQLVRFNHKTSHQSIGQVLIRSYLSLPVPHRKKKNSPNEQSHIKLNCFTAITHYIELGHRHFFGCRNHMSKFGPQKMTTAAVMRPHCPRTRSMTAKNRKRRVQRTKDLEYSAPYDIWYFDTPLGIHITHMYIRTQWVEIHIIAAAHVLHLYHSSVEPTS